MLSLILYGRNDNYGYNLHKRAALSLNCMAEILTDPQDEIIFVDYNTPDDFPTFPEAIRDTLTETARRRLRILRVRPTQHARFRDRTHLAALEPIARNVALRRSNPGNRWILSTNTDMIFVPRDARSLSEIAAGLDEDRYYHLPRFEIPETLWEGLDRLDPRGVIEKVRGWGADLHLNEIVFGSDVILYDAPGDFQLAARADLFRINGFDERMLRGWHVDSNLARRLGLIHGAPGTAVDHLFGYHCDHTRQVTPAHRHDRVENDSGAFVDAVSTPDIREQAESWGLAEDHVEEIRLDREMGYERALTRAIGAPMTAPTAIRYAECTYGQIDYDPRHVLPFLMDALASYPRTTRIAWIGSSQALLDRFTAAWAATGFTAPILVPEAADWLQPPDGGACQTAQWAALTAAADVFIVDFAPATGSTLSDVASGLRRMAAAERERQRDPAAASRRFIVVNAVHSRHENLVNALIAAAAAPIATRLRQGFLKPSGIASILPALGIGDAGERTGTAVRLLAGVQGYVAFGELDLLPGGYRLNLCMEAEQGARRRADETMWIELRCASGTLTQPIPLAAPGEAAVAVPFYLPASLAFSRTGTVNIRIGTRGATTAQIASITLEPADDVVAPSIADVTKTGADWLPAMFIGAAGCGLRPLGRGLIRSAFSSVRASALHRVDTARIVARWWRSGHVVFGPYCTLPPGRYQLELEFTAGKLPAGPRRWARPVAIEVYSAQCGLLARKELAIARVGKTLERLTFTAPQQEAGDNPPPELEFRVWSNGGVWFAINRVCTRPIRAAAVLESPADRAILEGHAA